LNFLAFFIIFCLRGPNASQNHCKFEEDCGKNQVFGNVISLLFSKMTAAQIYQKFTNNNI
jgi:hypothetical protein